MKNLILILFILSFEILVFTSCSKRETLAEAHSSNYVAELVRLHSLTAFDPDDLEIYIGSKGKNKRCKLIDVEGGDSAGMSFLNEHVLYCTDVRLPADQPGYLSKVASGLSQPIEEWNIPRGISTIKDDTSLIAEVNDSLITARVYESTNQFFGFYVFITITGREDFPQIFAFLNTKSLVAMGINPEKVEVQVQWDKYESTNDFVITRKLDENYGVELTLKE